MPNNFINAYIKSTFTFIRLFLYNTSFIFLFFNLFFLNFNPNPIYTYSIHIVLISIFFYFIEEYFIGEYFNPYIKYKVKPSPIPDFITSNNPVFFIEFTSNFIIG